MAAGYAVRFSSVPLPSNFSMQSSRHVQLWNFTLSAFGAGLARHPSRYPGTPSKSDRLIGPMLRAELAIREGCDAAD